MTASVLTDYLLPLCLACIMFGIGLSLTLADFARLLKKPGCVLTGLAGQIIVMPVIAIACAAMAITLAGLSPAMTMGIVLLAACPGGTMSNLMSHLLRADTALSVTLTALSTLICIITTPLLIGLGYTLFAPSSSQAISVAGITTGLLLMALLPVALGMIMRHLAPLQATRLEPGFQRFSLIFLGLLIVTMVVREWSLLINSGFMLIGLALLLSLLTSLCGWVSGRPGRLTLAIRRTLCIEVGIQNAALAMVIALSILEQPELAVFPGLYGIIMYLCPALICLASGRDYKAYAAKKVSPITEN